VPPARGDFEISTLLEFPACLKLFEVFFAGLGSPATAGKDACRYVGGVGDAR